MSVNVSDGSLDFVSTLDNSDFQSKSLENIRLIKLQLELTGDTSGITKYDQAVKNALATENKLRADLAKILEEARVKTQEFTQQVQQSAGAKTVFSDSKAEVEAYIASLGSINDVTFNGSGSQALIRDYSNDLSLLVDKEAELTASFEAGAISMQEYNTALAESRANQAGLIEQITALSLAETEQASSTAKAGVAAEEQIGILENLNTVLKELKAENLTIIDPQALAQSNVKIQELEAEITRFKNVGKVGFDEMGNAVEQTVQKTSRFEAALSRATNLSNIGATVVSRLSRQIIGLGVGMLSFAIGAKAIEFLVQYIENLDIFTGRLDQAKQNMIAFNEVMANADKAAGPQISSLKLLYEATTDVHNSMDKRLKAAQQLREEYPTEFANASTMAIANGKLKDSYNDLAESIINVARSEAAQKKMADLESQILDLDFQTDKTNFAKANQTKAAFDRYRHQLANDGTYGQISPEDAKASLLANLNQIKMGADASNSTSAEQRKLLQGQVDNLTQYVTNVGKTGKALEDANKYLGPQLENFDNLVKRAQSKQDLVNIQKDLQIKLNALKPGDADIKGIADKIRQVEELEKQYSPKVNDGKSAANADAQSLKAKLALLTQIGDALEAYNRKGLDADEASLKAVSDKFDALRKKIEVFNSDPKNVNHQIGASVVSNINSAEVVAYNNQNTDNQTAHIKDQLDQYKKLYADYEDYKLKAGSTTADAEYSELLKSGKNFQEYIDNISKYVDSSDDSGPMQKRAEMIQKFQQQEIEDQKKAFETLLLTNLTYEQKKESILIAGQDAEAKLRHKGLTEQADQAAKDTQDKLTAEDISHFKSLDAYKLVFDGVANLTKKQTQDNINKLYGVAAADLASGGSLEAYQTFVKQLKQAEDALAADSDGKRLADIGQGFQTIGDEISKVNGTLGSLISSAGSAFTALGKISDMAKQIESNGGSLFSKENWTDTVSLATTAISGTVSLINSITSSASERKAAEKAYYDSVIASQNEYNLSLDQQLQIQAQLNGNIFYKDYRNDILNASKALADENKLFEASLGQLSAKGQAIVGKGSKLDAATIGKDTATGAVTGAAIGALVGGGVLSVPFAAAGAVIGGLAGAITGLFSKKPKDELAPLFAAYPALLTKDKDGVTQFNEALAKNLIQNNLVSESTKGLLQNTIALNDARQASIDQINQDITDLAGSLGNDLQNALVTAFENGSDAAVAFGDSVSKVIDNIVAQFLFQDIFGDQFKKLEANLKQSFGISGDQNATDDLTQFFKDAGPLTAEYQQALQQAKDAAAAQGINLFQPGSSGGGGGISGGIKQSITEDTASVMTGTLKGIQLNGLNANSILETQQLTLGQLANLAQENLAIMQQINQNTKRGADNTDGLVDAVKQIVSNTGNTAATELRAAGKYGY